MSKLAEILGNNRGYGDRIHLMQEGSSHDDLLVGQSNGNDFLFGRAGNDILVASEGGGVNGGDSHENLQPNTEADLDQGSGEQVGVAPIAGDTPVVHLGTNMAINPVGATPFNLIP